MSFSLDSVSVIDCKEGFYGRNCDKPCNCSNGISCDSVSGNCQCFPGWTGRHCDKGKFLEVQVHNLDKPNNLINRSDRDSTSVSKSKILHKRKHFQIVIRRSKN